MLSLAKLGLPKRQGTTPNPKVSISSTTSHEAYTGACGAVGKHILHDVLAAAPNTRNLSRALRQFSLFQSTLRPTVIDDSDRMRRTSFMLAPLRSKTLSWPKKYSTGSIGPEGETHLSTGISLADLVEMISTIVTGHLNVSKSGSCTPPRRASQDAKPVE